MSVSSLSDRERRKRPHWQRGRELSLRDRLTVFTVCVGIAMIGLFFANVLYTRSVAVDVARRAAENLAESLAQQASETLEAVDGGLLTLAQRVQSDGTGSAVRDRLQAAMADLITVLPRLHGLSVVDEHGRLVVTNAPSASNARQRFGDQPYFRFHRDDSRPSIHISGPAYDPGENIWLICVTRRLNHFDGSFAGVALAQISLSYFDQTYANFDVGHAGSIALLSAAGIILDRKPRAFIARSVADSALFAPPYKFAQAGTYVVPAQVDGVRRLFAFRRLDRYPLIVNVGLAESEYLAQWRSGVWASSIALALVIAMIGGLAGGLAVQISRRKIAEDSLARLALLDGLTGLANRRQFDAVLEREWRRAARDRTSLALLMIDVDNFKAYNDRYGHQRGDEVLLAIAQTIATGIVRPSDLAARYGGEEFAVILSATDASSAMIVAERIRRAIVALGVPHAQAPGAIASVSIGVAGMVPEQSVERSTLVEAADAALYNAKRAGRNRTSRIVEMPGPLVSAPSPGSA